MHELELQHPEWFDKLASVDSLQWDRAGLDDLIATSPSKFTTGYLWGKLSSRLLLHAAMKALSLAPGAARSHRKEARSQKPVPRQREAGERSSWFAALVRPDPDVWDPGQLVRLLGTAPTSSMQGFLYGKLVARIEWAAMTRGSF